MYVEMYVEIQGERAKEAYISFLAEVFAKLGLEITPRSRDCVNSDHMSVIEVTWDCDPSVRISETGRIALDNIAAWVLKHCDYANNNKRGVSDMREFLELAMCFKVVDKYLLYKTCDGILRDQI